MLPSFLHESNEIVLQANQTVFSQGQSPENFLFVTEGCIKVFARSSEGKEVVIYRVRGNQICILTTACLLGHTEYQAEAVTEIDTTARVVPARLFEKLLNESEPFRAQVFKGFSWRLTQVLQRFEHMVLESVHQRLASFLLTRSNSQNCVETTHELLAVEIGTAREVVSRHLKSMEQEGLIKTSRGRIELLHPESFAVSD